MHTPRIATINHEMRGMWARNGFPSEGMDNGEGRGRRREIDGRSARRHRNPLGTAPETATNIEDDFSRRGGNFATEQIPKLS